ncbi:MAG TPA: aminodeoxychorismate/anthranilate synthase component II [Bacteroidales bacterium]|nr:aminodeoxychorismate/anthranilate synthase component II [Bacteroidales bacterium]
MKILVFDNYDSFTYNIVQYVEQITGSLPVVARNDRITLEKVDEFDRIILSPGPGIPSESGLLLPLIRRFAPIKPMLGICLGLQAMAESFGGQLINLGQVFHGVATIIHRTAVDEPLFDGTPQSFAGARYHSWVADRATLPHCFHITAEDENGLVMAIRHREYALTGLQFHPESILSPYGGLILKNWLTT